MCNFEIVIITGLTNHIRYTIIRYLYLGVLKKIKIERFFSIIDKLLNVQNLITHF